MMYFWQVWVSPQEKGISAVPMAETMGEMAETPFCRGEMVETMAEMVETLMT